MRNLPDECPFFGTDTSLSGCNSLAAPIPRVAQNAEVARPIELHKESCRPIVDLVSDVEMFSI